VSREINNLWDSAPEGFRNKSNEAFGTLGCPKTSLCPKTLCTDGSHSLKICLPKSAFLPAQKELILGRQLFTRRGSACRCGCDRDVVLRGSTRFFASRKERNAYLRVRQIVYKQALIRSVRLIGYYEFP
jgi:hypothetical protein